MNRVLFTVISAIFFPLVLTAQTVKWTVKPDYDKIDRYSDDLFKCKKGSTLQLVDLSGNLLLDVEADSVTDYDGGYALVLQEKRILGFINETKPHRFTKVNGDYYAVNYSFFSEGLLAVANSQGKQGYLNTEGDLAIKCKFRVAGPFRQGWAVVKDESFGYITTSIDNPIRKDRTAEYTFIQVSSFNEKGLAVACCKKGLASKSSTLIINTDLIRVETLNHDDDFKLSSVTNKYDYSYRPSDSSPKERPVNNLPAEDGNVEVYGFTLKGYRAGQNTIAPEQFKTAMPFAGGYAIVSNGEGKFGVIQQVQGQVNTTLSDTDIRVYPDNSCKSIVCDLQVPDAINSHVLLKIDNGDGVMRDVSLQQGQYSFKPYLGGGKNGSAKVRMEVHSDDGLLLLQKEETITLHHIDVVCKTPYVTTPFADEKGYQTVKAVITNKSDVAVDVAWSLSVGGKTATGTGKLQRNATLDAKNSVKVESEEETAHATVTYKVDGVYAYPSHSATVTLKKN